MHPIHIHHQLPQCLQDVLLVGLVRVTPHRHQGVQTLVVHKLQDKVLIILKMYLKGTSKTDFIIHFIPMGIKIALQMLKFVHTDFNPAEVIFNVR